ncbi:MAG TPA: UbiA family prenyltransferase [Solirubrobacteraceae bacterium]|nr:UbiA family prenyltransferase [Solirubrobacteraceae bacterium]
MAVAASARRPSLASAFLTISRWEFMPGGVFFIFASAALATLSWSALSDRLSVVAWGACVWYLSHLVGSQVNCLADVEIDEREKAHLSRAVRRFGPPRIVALLVAESLAAIAVTVYMAVDTGRAALPFLWVAGLAIALAYSLEPVRLKRRGWLNPIALMLVLYALPMAYGYVALAERASAEAIAAICAIGLQMLALILLNAAADVRSDRLAGVETPCVRHGLAPVAAVAALAYAAGAAVAIACFAALAEGQGAPNVAGLAVAAAGQLYVLQEIVRLAALTRRGEGLESPAVVHLVKRNPVHFAVLGVSLAAASALVLQ